MAGTATKLHHLLEYNRHHRIVIKGTRVLLQRIVGLHQEGLTPERISSGFPNVPLPAVYAALSHYYEHQQELDDEELADAQAALKWARENGAEIVG